jgi:hypothetical protein
VSLVIRGLTYPRVKPRPQAVRVSPKRPATRAQLMLLEGAGEEEFSRWVKSRAHYWGWNGYHVRDSEGVMESIHTKRVDGYCDGLGVPDWRFWHEDLGQTFDAELKGASGHLQPDQRREIPSMRKGGMTVFVWYPRDAALVEDIFQYGLEGHRFDV